jgi:hypothetical protein
MLVALAAAGAAGLLQVAQCQDGGDEDDGIPCVVIQNPSLLNCIQQWLGW